MRYKAIAFDWDGTLVDSIDHIVGSMKGAAERMSLAVRANQDIRDIIGLGMNEAIRTLYADMSDRDVDLFRGHYSDVFFATEVGKKNLFPNADELLGELGSRGVRLAVATGKSRRGLDIALQSTGLKKHFSVERCADESRSKPHPLMLNQIMAMLDVLPEEMLMVGDTDYDMEMAQRAGVDRLGVSFGAQPVERLECYNPVGIIDDLSDLMRYIAV